MGWAISMTIRPETNQQNQQQENHAKDQDDNKPNHGKSRKKGK
jgi:hypothetical protein